MIKERIEELRKLMSKNNIDAYLIPTNDFHGSEYVGDYFNCRRYITGFTGSAGILRYFILIFSSFITLSNVLNTSGIMWVC